MYYHIFFVIENMQSMQMALPRLFELFPVARLVSDELALFDA